MPEKLDAIMPKLVPLVRMLSSPTEQEAFNALRALLRLLHRNGFDIHAIADRIEHGGEPLDAAEMQKIYDAAYEKGYGDGAEQGKRSAILAAQPSAPSPPASTATSTAIPGSRSPRTA